MPRANVYIKYENKHRFPKESYISVKGAGESIMKNNLSLSPQKNCFTKIEKFFVIK